MSYFMVYIAIQLESQVGPRGGQRKVNKLSHPLALNAAFLAFFLSLAFLKG
jgi:hypothetical protein